MARPCRPCSAMDDPLASRCIDAALVLSESAARADFRGPDPFDGLWWHWPKAVVGGRRRRQAVMQAARPRAGRHPPSLSPSPPADPQGPRHLRLGRGARSSPRRRRASRAPPDAARSDLLDSDRSAGPRAWGYHWDMQTRWSFYPAGQPQRRRHGVRGQRPARGAALTGRAQLRRARSRRCGWAADELWVEPEGYFAYHPGRPVNIHNANLLGAWLVAVAGAGAAASPRARRAGRAANDRRAAPRRVVALRRGAQPRLGGLLPLRATSCCASIACAPWTSASAMRCARGAATTARSSTRRAARACGRTSPSPRTRHSAGTGLSALAALVRRGLVERALLERVALRVLEHGLRDGHAVHRRYRWGATTGALPALVRRARRPRARRRRRGLRGAGDLAPSRFRPTPEPAGAPRRGAAAPGACGSTGAPRREPAGAGGRCRRAAPTRPSRAVAPRPPGALRRSVSNVSPPCSAISSRSRMAPVSTPGSTMCTVTPGGSPRSTAPLGDVHPAVRGSSP